MEHRDVGAVEVAVTSLQAVIDAALPGETINVPPGTYTENITIGDGKVLFGAGAGSTIIDGNGGRTVELVAGAVSGDAKLENLTVRNGQADESVGGNIDTNGFPPPPDLAPAPTLVSTAKAAGPARPDVSDKICVACHSLPDGSNNRLTELLLFGGSTLPAQFIESAQLKLLDTKAKRLLRYAPLPVGTAGSPFTYLPSFASPARTARRASIVSVEPPAI